MARLARVLGVSIATALLVLGWLTLVLGVLFAVAVAIFSLTGYGDGSPHFAWEDVEIPVGVLAVGAVLVWIGRTARRAALRPPPSSVPPPR